MSQHESLEPAVAEPLAGIAAAIGDRIREQEVSEAALLELSVTTIIPSDGSSHARDSDRSPNGDELSDEYEDPHAERGDEDSLAERSVTSSSHVDDDLPAHAWGATLREVMPARTAIM